MAQIKFRTPKQVVKKWIKTLRSGKYRQGQGCLREVCKLGGGYEPNVTFCCLGVLQDIAVKDGGQGWDTPTGPGSSDSQPTGNILKYIGLTDDMVERLIQMNDDEKRIFDEIADEIEFKMMPKMKLQ